MILFTLLVFAAGLRLARLGIVEFKYDEATTARMALEIVERGRLPLVGMISSQGPHNPPLMSYILAIPFALSRDPRWAVGWIALLNVAAVGLTYGIGRAYFGRFVAVVAALLFAASPWAVLHSRKIWTQNLPLFTLLFIAAALAFSVRRRPWALTGMFAAAAALFGLHLGGMAFFFIGIFIVALFARQVRPFPLFAGVGAAMVIVGPYLYYDATHSWSNVRLLFAMRSLEARTDLQAAYMAGLATGGYHLEDLAGERYQDFVASIPDLRWLDRAGIALFWLGLVWLIVRLARAAVRHYDRLPSREAARLVLLCWFGVPIALLFRHSVPIFPHTLLLLYPVQHVIIALLLHDAAVVMRAVWGRRASRAMMGIGMALVGLLIAWQAYLWQALLTFVSTHDTPGGFGVPLKDTLAVVERTRVFASQMGGTEIVVSLPGADPRYDGQAAVFDVLFGSEARLVDGRKGLVFPARGAVYLADPSAVPALTFLGELNCRTGARLPVRTGSALSYRLVYCPGTVAVPPRPWERGPAYWAVGLRLLGSDWSGMPAPGGVLHWRLYLRVEQGLPVAVGDLHCFNHLVDSQGNRWGQMDGPISSPAAWRSGDVLVQWFDIPISPEAPPGPYFIRLGLYIYPDIVNVQLLDEAGNPTGEFVEVGPIGL